jgi:predicted phage terminase large subunit-like protein
MVTAGQWKMARHLAAIDELIVDTVLGKSPSTLIVSAPPRHGKSELCSLYLPSWFLGCWPDRNVILASHSADFSAKYGRQCRNLLEEHGRELFGVTVSQHSHSAAEWEIAKHGGGMVTTGVGGSVVGRGADLLIIDDYIKDQSVSLSELVRDHQWDWWQSSISTRVNPGGTIVIIATRWHDDDLVGRIVKHGAERGGRPIRELVLPALAEENDALGRAPGECLWPEQWSQEQMEQECRGRLAHWWNALYQQRPGRFGRSEWPPEYFGEHIWAEAWPDSFDLSVVAVDPSKGRDRGDFSAIVFLGLSGGRLYVDCSIQRRPVSQIVTDTMAMCRVYNPDAVGIEENMHSGLLSAEVERQVREQGGMPLPIHTINNRDPKVLRIARIGPYLDRQHIRFRDSADCRVMVRQLEEFPLARHDDGPDALEMDLRLLEWLQGGQRVFEPEYVEAV